MKVTAQDLKGLGVIDAIVPEPLGGAHRDPGGAISALGAAIEASLGELSRATPETLIHERRRKFLNIGRV